LSGPDQPVPESQSEPAVGYDSYWHDIHHDGAEVAARRVLPLVFQLADIESVVDVGCGYGAWLSVAGDLGARALVGVEGPWAVDWRDRGMFDPRLEIVFQDLEHSIELERRFDLAVCLETAEHLSPERGPGLIDELCCLAPVILFSAALPGQGGYNHFNEQPLSAWVREFAAHRYRPLDLLRRRFWDDKDVPFWYAQNLMLFVTESRRSETESRAAALPPLDDAAGVDLVHPKLAHMGGRLTDPAEWPERIPWLRDPKQIGVRDRVHLAVGLPGASLRALRRRWKRYKSGKLFG
jgi:SAM-dependent methyltransferase